jgi:hypothetical protein
MAAKPAWGAVAWALLLSFAMVRLGPAAAQDSDDAYSATVRVDATADSAATARDMARIDGQRRALAALIGRLSGASEPATLPKLDDKAITDMVESFEVANERMSAVRYIADCTFHFRPAKVRRLVRMAESVPAESGSKDSAETGGKSSAENGGKAPVETGSKSMVVLPVYQDGPSLVLWHDPNAWRAAWAQGPAGVAPSRLILPLGDAGDLTTIDSDKAKSADPDALTAIAKRNGGSETVVALAIARRQGDRLAGLDVSVKRYRAGHLVDARSNSYDAGPAENEEDFLRRTAGAVAADIENAAKKNVAGRSDQQASLAVTVPITSLGEWVQVRRRLASVPAIRKIDLLSLSRQEARIELKYVGDQDQLKSSLAEVNLEIGGGNPVWRIQQSGMTSPR